MIIGIDPSLTSTAYCAINADGQRVDHGDLHTNLKGVARLLHIEEQLKTALAWHLGIQLICIEGYAFARANQAHQLGELGGIIRRHLYTRNYKYIDVPPGTLKKYATGKGNAPKDQITAYVFKRWGFMAENNNIADAFVLAQIGHALVYNTQVLTKGQDATLAKLRLQYQEVTDACK